MDARGTIETAAVLCARPLPASAPPGPPHFTVHPSGRGLTRTRAGAAGQPRADTFTAELDHVFGPGGDADAALDVAVYRRSLVTRLLDGGGDGSGDPAILVSVVEVGAGHKPCDLVAGGGGPALELGKHTVASLRATTCVTAALQKRRTAATGLNATSSRTHGIVVLRLAEGGTLVVSTPDLFTTTLAHVIGLAATEGTAGNAKVMWLATVECRARAGDNALKNSIITLEMGYRDRAYSA
ncbi:hypothetical protein P8C59_006491 [Phyllachora maydis]|uniref:Kinesin motor domain-containing protein n=1 Tax=Phyllachora maydis TaxID=1825666 RepID=A0AAD9I7L4_9PEZI|nr:hypothetical protein P8C59_006491 [Phyllachora maydis]